MKRKDNPLEHVALWQVHGLTARLTVDRVTVAGQVWPAGTRVEIVNKRGGWWIRDLTPQKRGMSHVPARFLELETEPRRK